MAALLVDRFCDLVDPADVGNVEIQPVGDALGIGAVLATSKNLAGECPD